MKNEASLLVHFSCPHFIMMIIKPVKRNFEENNLHNDLKNGVTLLSVFGNLETKVLFRVWFYLQLEFKTWQCVRKTSTATAGKIVSKNIFYIHAQVTSALWIPIFELFPVVHACFLSRFPQQQICHEIWEQRCSTIHHSILRFRCTRIACCGQDFK